MMPRFKFVCIHLNVASLIIELVISSHILFSSQPVYVTLSLSLAMLCKLFPGSPR